MSSLSSLNIPRYGRAEFIGTLARRMQDDGWPGRQVAKTVFNLREGYIGPRRKAEDLMDALRLTTAERSEFRRHFYGGD